MCADVLAGVTVALVALPLSIAIAIASGGSPAQGLVTAIVAGFMVSALGGSRVQIGGPTGAFIVVVAHIIADHGYEGLLLATLMAGLILILAGILRFGSLIAYVPASVVDGFTVGIALIIATSQLNDAFGLSIENLPAGFAEKLPLIFSGLNGLSLAALGITISTGVLIVLFRHAAPRLPGLIVAVAATSFIASAVSPGLLTPIETISSRFGELPSGLPTPTLPSISWSNLSDLLPSAFTIAFLAGIESLLSAVVADRMIDDHHKPNAEVIAQGAANITSALFGGLPATGAIARTATNVRAGARTPLAGIFHALVILAIMLIAGPMIGQLALPALAALLILTAWNMSEPHRWSDRLRMRRSDQVVFSLTFALTVLADLTTAIAVGTAFGLAARLRRREIPPTDWSTPER